MYKTIEIEWEAAKLTKKTLEVSENDVVGEKLRVVIANVEINTSLPNTKEQQSFKHYCKIATEVLKIQVFTSVAFRAFIFTI